MLIISRKRDESVLIGDEIKITILEIGANQVRLGIEAPKEQTILREELILQIKNENSKAVEVSVNNLDQLSKIFKLSRKE